MKTCKNVCQVLTVIDFIVVRVVCNQSSYHCCCFFPSQQQQMVVTEHLNVLYGELMGLLDHQHRDIQSQAKRALRNIFAFRVMYTT